MAQAKMKLDMPFVQLLFFRAMIHLVQLVMKLSGSLSLLKAVRNSEQQEDEPHFQLFLSQVMFCTLLQQFQKDRGLCFMLQAMDLKFTYFIIFYLKNTNSNIFFCSAYR